MFAPAATRADLWALYAFNQELGQVRTLVRDPMAGMIRLQWWREVVERQRDDEARRNPVAAPLLEVIDRRQLPLTTLERLIAVRERDLEPAPFAGFADLRGYAEDGAGALAELAARVLAGPAGLADQTADLARQAGAACAVVGLLRSLPFHLSQGWLTLPADVLVRHGGGVETALAGREARPVLAAAVLEVAGHARGMVAVARRHRPGRRVLPALLPLVPAAAHLARLHALKGDVFDSRSFAPRPMPLRLVWAMCRGRP